MYFFHEQNEREPVNASPQKEEPAVRVLPSRGINKKHQTNHTAALLLPSHEDSFSIKKMSEPIVSTSTMSSYDTFRTDDAVIPHQEDYSLRRHSLTLVKPTTSRKRGISFLSGEKATQGNTQHEVNFLGKSLKRVSTTNSCFVLEAKYGERQFHKAEHQSESLLEIPVICKKSSNASCISIISSNQRRRKSEIFSKANTSFNSSNGSLNSKQKVPLEFSAGVFSSSNQRGSDTNVAYYDKGVEATENRAWLQNESLRFNKSVDDQISSVEDAKLLVKKTREVSMLSNRFMLASTENECYEILFIWS
ncbi:predicted protein [Chaetoceros tenuissimus]|uniref:Uncharacterized protein n=1 Tax=Chaetoceros tenuissimus TaxID=426638 RepID=A0AAD3DC11_9STRA|nr:predicted protein [Chaetoceros tenuissimus]